MHLRGGVLLEASLEAVQELSLGTAALACVLHAASSAWSCAAVSSRSPGTGSAWGGVGWLPLGTLAWPLWPMLAAAAALCGSGRSFLLGGSSASSAGCCGGASPAEPAAACAYVTSGVRKLAGGGISLCTLPGMLWLATCD
eukprot:6480520-Amphidinium_carterae.2